MEYVLLVLLIILILGVSYIGYLLNKKISSSQEENSKDLEQSIRQVLPDVMSQVNKSVIELANEKLGSEKKEIRVDMQNKKDEIEKIVKRIHEELKENNQRLEKVDKERVGSYKSLEKSLEEQRKITSDLSANTENLKKLLSNNQLRGQFGEQVAEDLLKMVGFVRGTDYEIQEEQANRTARPDFTVYLPDGTKINVDSKFPFASLQKMAETDDKAQKIEFQKQFERDVKQKIKQVASKDYINPDEKTVDFVILFIPNEMIFSFIYDKMPVIWRYAMESKVVLAGPFSFTAILRMVRQAYDNFRYQENIKEIITHVKTFEDEFGKFYEEFEKIGTRIKSLETQYEKVATTRTNQLVRRMDKVKMVEGSDEDESPKLLD